MLIIEKQWSDDIYDYTQYTNGTFSQTVKTVPIGQTNPTLDDVKNAKITELTNANNAITTFQSSALGLVHTYLADDKAMGKLNGEYTFINGSNYDGSPILWFTLEEGGVIHTKAQFNQVWLDGRNVMVSSFNKWDNLVKKVKVCTTVDQVNAIKW